MRQATVGASPARNCVLGRTYVLRFQQ
jgi:hypothetical protein